MKNENYFFPVQREKLYRENGEYSNYDVLANKETNDQISVVSSRYHVTTHRDAHEFAMELFSKQGIDVEIGKRDITPSGGRFFSEYRFPGLKFSAGSIDTAIDATGKSDIYIPTLVMKNSYDKSSALDFTFGGFRFVCANGMLLGTIIDRIKLDHNHKPDFKNIGKRLIDNLELTIENFKAKHEELNTLRGAWYTPLLLDVLSKEIFMEVVRSSSDMIQVTPYIDDDGNHKLGTKTSNNLSAYALLQIVTEILSHKVKDYRTSVKYQKKVAKVFEM